LPSAREKIQDQEVEALRRRVRELEAENARLRAAQAPEAPSQTEKPVSPTHQDPVEALLVELGDRVTAANRESATLAAIAAVGRRDATPDRRLAAVSAFLEKTGIRDPGAFVGRLVQPAGRDGAMPDAEVASRVAAVRNGPPGLKVLSPEDSRLLMARSALADSLALSGCMKHATLIRRENDKARKALALPENLRKLGSDRTAVMADVEARNPVLFPKADPFYDQLVKRSAASDAEKRRGYDYGPQSVAHSVADLLTGSGPPPLRVLDRETA